MSQYSHYIFLNFKSLNPFCTKISVVAVGCLLLIIFHPCFQRKYLINTEAVCLFFYVVLFNFLHFICWFLFFVPKVYSQFNEQCNHLWVRQQQQKQKHQAILFLFVFRKNLFIEKKTYGSLMITFFSFKKFKGNFSFPTPFLIYIFSFFVTTIHDLLFVLPYSHTVLNCIKNIIIKMISIQHTFIRFYYNYNDERNKCNREYKCIGIFYKLSSQQLNGWMISRFLIVKKNKTLLAISSLDVECNCNLYIIYIVALLIVKEKKSN